LILPNDMHEKLREAWSKAITPEDYEAHMAAVGQAQANAALVAEYLESLPPKRHASLLFVGAGTGQMFDFVSSEILLPYNITFTDINASYLNRLRARLTPVPGLRYATVVDDLERTTLSRRFDLVLAVLVLEHVDWRAATATLCKLAGKEIFVVIQENPPELATAMTPRAQVPQTMRIFAEVHPELVPVRALESEMRERGFVSSYVTHKVVADNKKMLAFAFRRETT
jgi:2-polyprenyl-3-methyl-5-hydroxy-6-metoxy-1,4-benzoquinol methylase